MERTLLKGEFKRSSIILFSLEASEEKGKEEKQHKEGREALKDFTLSPLKNCIDEEKKSDSKNKYIAQF